MDVIKKRLATGLVVLIPLGITIFALRFLYGVLTSLLLPFIEPMVSHLPLWLRIVSTVGVLLALLLVVGQVATHVVGRRVISLAEKVVTRIPLVRVIYAAAKQVVDSFGSSREEFQTVVMIEFPSPGMRALGFLTNTVTGPDGKEWCAVFVPTTPNPTTGFLQLVPAEGVVPLDWEIDDAARTLMSLGVLAPKRMQAQPRADGARLVGRPVERVGADSD